MRTFDVTAYIRVKAKNQKDAVKIVREWLVDSRDNLEMPESFVIFDNRSQRYFTVS